MIKLGLISTEDLEKITSSLSGRAALVRSELAKATNKAAREVVNLSVEEWNLYFTAQGYAKSRLDIVSGATSSRLEAVVSARNRATRANRFSHRQLPGGGVHLNVRRGRPGGTLRNAFMVRAKSDGQPLILERLTPYRRGEPRSFRGGRFRAVYAPSVNQFFWDARKRVAPKALSDAKKQFLEGIR